MNSSVNQFTSLPMIKNPIMLALDVDSDVLAFQILDQVADYIGAVKIGPRLNLKYGSEFVKRIKAYAPVFVDNKYFDITSTVLSAIQTSFDSGATFVTVHALNGFETLVEIAQLEKKLNLIRPFKILGVTVLTSWSEKNLPENFKNLNIQNHVEILSDTIMKSGLSGVVCSGHELSLFNKPETKNIFKVVPGIRLEQDLTNDKNSEISNYQDQKRIMTPRQAIQHGASALVIGRSILNSKSPLDTVQQILESLKI